ncbi:hypothetical protein ACHAWO_005473 [Cyclotella atomus]|uniref:Uncharacterized protein n=1 Tax=Cyclotella atomus TaxID=382360 RepID=A0ABD3QXD7_9STRA
MREERRSRHHKSTPLVLRLVLMSTVYPMVVLAKLSRIITSYRITSVKDDLVIRSDGCGLSRIKQNPSLLATVVGDLFRGGDDGSSSTPNHIKQYPNQGNYNDSMSSGTQSSENNFNQGIPPSQMQQQVYQQPYAEDGDFSNGMYHNPDESFYGQRESVEDRLAAWRLQQQQMQESLSPEQAASAVDEQGRFKLFTTVSRVSVSFFFFILMWRTVHHYELADAAFGSSKGVKAAFLRSMVVTPLVVLFLGEMMGAILGLTGGSIGGGGSASHATKKRLKGILNLHKGVELVMLVYNVIRLAVWPSRYVIREVYIGRTISNFFFLMQAQLYTKLSWDDVSKTNIGESYVNYQPDPYDDQFDAWQNTQTQVINDNTMMQRQGERSYDSYERRGY